MTQQTHDDVYLSLKLVMYAYYTIHTNSGITKSKKKHKLIPELLLV